MLATKLRGQVGLLALSGAEKTRHWSSEPPKEKRLLIRTLEGLCCKNNGEAETDNTFTDPETQQ